MHGFTPALAIGQEVLDRGQVFARYVRRLYVDRVEAANDSVVCKRHFCCDIICRVRGLGVDL